MERWLLLANCQTFGLVNCLNLAGSSFEVTGIDIWKYMQDTAGTNASFPEYDRVLIQPEMRSVAGADFAGARNLTLVPPIYFDGYHPDVCFAEGPDGVLVGPLRDYQSMIALAAYNQGLGVADTMKLYRGDIYDRCGYFQAWDVARDRLIGDFDNLGFDVRLAFLRWTRQGPFMFSTNHPRIHAIQDVAAMLLRKEGLEVRATDIVPGDNLANGPCFPILPEIGEALGVEGSLLFKLFNVYRYISLEEYIQASFELFGKHPRGSLTVGGYQARFERVSSVIRNEA
jgi:hypothetical protein